MSDMSIIAKLKGYSLEPGECLLRIDDEYIVVNVTNIEFSFQPQILPSIRIEGYFHDKT
jgi:hypothetical protein